MKEFAESVTRGHVEGTFRDINVDGVGETVEKIRLAALKKSKKSNAA